MNMQSVLMGIIHEFFLSTGIPILLAKTSPTVIQSDAAKSEVQL